MTDPFIGSLIVLYSIIALLVGMWLTLELLRRLARRYHIPSDSWLAGILMVLSFYLALVMAVAWPVLLLYNLWKNQGNRKGNNVRS